MEKIALIITDGADSSKKMADVISMALSPWKPELMTAHEFDVTRLLAADAFFLGAESPNPASFSALSSVLAHINLAGRPCGVFSASKEAADYLGKLVHDSEAVLCPEPYMGQEEVKGWTQKVLNKGKN